MRHALLIATLLATFPAASSALAAGELRSVTADARGIDIVVDDSRFSVESYTVSDPPRLVVDLKGVTGYHGRASRPLAGAFERVRIGLHGDKLRVVFDAIGPIPPHRIARTEDGLRIEWEAAEPPALTRSVPANMAPDESADPAGAPSGEPEPVEPGPIVAQAEPDGPTFSELMGEDAAPPAEGEVLTLEDAILQALQNNLDIEIARTGPLVAQEQVQQAEGQFDPVGAISSSFLHNEQPIASSLQTSDLVAANEWDYTTGLVGSLPFGLSYSSNLVMHRTETDSAIVSLAREWRSGWETVLTMPLLRNLNDNELNVTLKRSRTNEDESLYDFEANLSDLIQGVDVAYWELGAARAGERVAEKSFETAQELHDQTVVQYEVGVVSRVAVAQAEAGVAQRKFDLILAQNLTGRRQDELLNLTLAPDARTYAQRRVLTEDPTFSTYDVDGAAAIAKAIELRPELNAARERLELSEIELDFAVNQRRPRFDLVASYSTDGLAGVGKPAAETLFGVAGPDIGPSQDAFKKWFDDDGAHSWSLVGQFEVPIGNNTANARVLQRQIEHRRVRTELRREEQQVILDVRGAVRNLRSADDAVGAARERQAAEAESLRAEQEKLRLGDSTPFLVLEIEEDLAEAERQLVFALQSHQNALTDLDHSQGTLLRARGISIDEELDRY